MSFVYIPPFLHVCIHLFYMCIHTFFTRTYMLFFCTYSGLSAVRPARGVMFVYTSLLHISFTHFFCTYTLLSLCTNPSLFVVNEACPEVLFLDQQFFCNFKECEGIQCTNRSRPIMAPLTTKRPECVRKRERYIYHS